MGPIDRTIDSFQQLVAEVPEILQPIIVMLAAAIPFVEGEVGAIIGIVGGLHPVVAAVAAATGNFLCVLLVVGVTSRARTAVVVRRRSTVAVGGGGAASDASEEGLEQTVTERESKGRQRFRRWLVRFGVPGASILGPLAIPTQFTAAILVGGGTPRRWVLLWQAVAIAVWTTLATVSTWAALTYLVRS
nr:small multidrug efflux protein [uncultured Actinotalea sp.]